jgi:hypothetical protein
MYYNVDEVKTATLNLFNASGGFGELIELDEPSANGRDCHALKIGIPGAVEKPAVLIIGGLHADEWGSCEIALNFAADLLKALKQQCGLGYGDRLFTHADIVAMLTAIDVIVFPLVNPDGRAYSQTTKDQSGWRKSRRDLLSDGSEFGVDLNRNFDFLFKLSAFDPNAGVQSTSDLHSLMVYQGPGAFSEPETRNVRSLLDDHPVRWFVDLHAGSQTVQYVWSDDDTQTLPRRSNETFRDSFFDGKRGLGGGYSEYMDAGDLQTHRDLAKRFVDDIAAVGPAPAPGMPFTWQPSYQGVPYSGTSHDYAYSRHLLGTGLPKVLSFCVEWNFLSQPPWADMPAVITRITAGLIGFCQAAALAGPA